MMTFEMFEAILRKTVFVGQIKIIERTRKKFSKLITLINNSSCIEWLKNGNN